MFREACFRAGNVLLGGGVEFSFSMFMLITPLCFCKLLIWSKISNLVHIFHYACTKIANFGFREYFKVLKLCCTWKPQ